MPMQPHPWLQPLHRRVLTTIACTLFLAFESWYELGGIWFWLMLFATSYAIWDFFLSDTYRRDHR